MDRPDGRSIGLSREGGAAMTTCAGQRHPLVEARGIVRSFGATTALRDASISVTAGGATSGQLHALAGSHRALVWSGSQQPHLDLTDVPLPTNTGDVTIHPLGSF